MTRKSRIKVLQIAPSLGVHGGIEAVAVSIVQECAAESDIDCHLFFRQRGKGALADDFTELISPYSDRISLFRKNPLPLIKAMLRTDIVHCHYPALWVLIPAFLLGKSTLITVHNKKPPGKILLRFFERVALRMVNKVVFNSNFVAGTWGFRDGDFERVPAVAESNRRIRPSDERSGFIVLARLIPEKGIGILIKAYQRASIDHLSHPLLIVGTGPQMEELRQLASQGKSDQIRFLGHRHGDDKARLLAAALWNIAPAVYQEDQGMTPIEASLCRVPSIVSAVGGLPESAGPGAIMVTPHDVDELSKALELAVGMKSEEYEKRCFLNEEYLKKYLPIPRHYTLCYSNLI